MNNGAKGKFIVVKIRYYIWFMFVIFEVIVFCTDYYNFSLDIFFNDFRQSISLSSNNIRLVFDVYVYHFTI